MHGEDETPRIYLSTNGGRWRVIHGGSPVCADCDEAQARAVFRALAPGCKTPPIWDGDAGRFREFGRSSRLELE